ncbi:MAG: hypothetical protein ACR2N4_05280, partial [Jatrophihabitans sp.]
MNEPVGTEPVSTELAGGEPAVTWLAGPTGIRLVEPAPGPQARTGRPRAAGLVVLVLLVCFVAARLARPAAPAQPPAASQATASQAAASRAAVSSLEPAGAQWPVSANQVVISCTEQQVDDLVHSFVSAVDRGDQAALTKLIAAAGQGFMS